MSDIKDAISISNALPANRFLFSDKIEVKETIVYDELTLMMIFVENGTAIQHTSQPVIKAAALKQHRNKK